MVFLGAEDFLPRGKKDPEKNSNISKVTELIGRRAGFEDHHANTLWKPKAIAHNASAGEQGLWDK